LDLVNAVAFLPDSKTLALASVNLTIKLWDADLGKLLSTLKGHSYLFNAVAFLPDGKTLASALWDGTVELWEAGLGTLLSILKLDYVIKSLSISNNRTLLHTNKRLLHTKFLPSSEAVS
jgi:WD40 repeat protein